MSAKDELVGDGGMMDEEESSSESTDEDAVAKAAFRRLKSALKGDDDMAGVEAMKRLMAACSPMSDDEDYSEH